MEGRIGNRAVLAKIAETLKLEGIKQAPSMANLDEVTCVLDISSFLFSQPLATPNEGSGERVGLTNQRSIGFEIDSAIAIVGDLGNAGEPNLPSDPDQVYVFENLSLNLSLTTAGAIALNGKIISFQLLTIPFNDGDGEISYIVHLPQWAKVETGKLDYVWSMLQHSTSNIDGSGVAYGSPTWDGVHHVNGYLRYDGKGVTSLGNSGSVYLYAKIRVLDTGFGANLWPAGTTATIRCQASVSNNGVVPS